MTKGANGSIHKLVIARAWKARGNLSMGYNYLFMEFFFFSVFGGGFVVYGLLRRFTPRNDEGGKNDGYGLLRFAHNDEKIAVIVRT